MLRQAPYRSVSRRWSSRRWRSSSGNKAAWQDWAWPLTYRPLCGYCCPVARARAFAMARSSRASRQWRQRLRCPRWPPRWPHPGRYPRPPPRSLPPRWRYLRPRSPSLLPRWHNLPFVARRSWPNNQRHQPYPAFWSPNLSRCWPSWSPRWPNYSPSWPRYSPRWPNYSPRSRSPRPPFAKRSLHSRCYSPRWPRSEPVPRSWPRSVRWSWHCSPS